MYCYYINISLLHTHIVLSRAYDLPEVVCMACPRRGEGHSPAPPTH